MDYLHMMSLFRQTPNKSASSSSKQLLAAGLCFYKVPQSPQKTRFPSREYLIQTTHPTISKARPQSVIQTTQYRAGGQQSFSTELNKEQAAFCHHFLPDFRRDWWLRCKVAPNFTWKCMALCFCHWFPFLLSQITAQGKKRKRVNKKKGESGERELDYYSLSHWSKSA